MRRDERARETSAAVAVGARLQRVVGRRRRREERVGVGHHVRRPSRRSASRRARRVAGALAVLGNPVEAPLERPDDAILGDRRRAGAPTRGRRLEAFALHAILPASCGSRSDTRKRSRPKAGRPCRSVCARTLIRSHNRAITLPTRSNTASAFLIDRPERSTEDYEGYGGHESMAIEVGILGATGMVGQQFIALLANHPWFKVDVARRQPAIRRQGVSRRRRVAAADAAAGRRRAADGRQPPTPGRAPKLVFSGLDSSVAGEIEGAFAQAGHVIVSNSRNYRMEADVPLLIPEVNADHLALLDDAGAARGWKGRIVTNPNCVVVVLRDGARAAAAVRSEDVDDHDAAGDLRRRLSRRARRGTSSATSSRSSAAARKRRSRPRRTRSSAR